MGGGRPGCDPGFGCRGNEFGEGEVRWAVESYRRSGPGRTTRHRTVDVEAIVRDAGLVARFRRNNLFWQVAVYERG
jgi:hypothetical protein